MSIDNVNDLPPRAQYTAAPGQTEFPYPFPIFQNADLVVLVDGAELTLTDDYSVSDAGADTGGFVTLTTALAGGEVVTIYRDSEISRTSDFPQNGPWFSVATNDELDRLFIIAQELRQALKRAIRFPMTASQTDAGAELSPISNWLDRYLHIDANGNLVPAAAIGVTVLTQALIGSVFQPQTAAEAAVPVTPQNYFLPEGHVERYTTWVSAATDFTTAFQNAAAVARSKPGLAITFTPGRTYATTALGGDTLFDLEGARGVTVHGNGATISAGNVNSGWLDVFDLNGAQDIEIRGLKYQQSYMTLDPTNGARFFYIHDSASRITLVDCEQVGGYGGIVCVGELTSGGNRSDQITALNCRFENVYYPQSFQGSGDQYFARGVKTIKCGRGYFPYNARNHDVEMVSQHGGPFDDCSLKVYADPGSSYNRLENIKLKYWSDGKASTGVNTTSGAIVSLDIQQNSGTTTPAEMSNIDIEVIFDAGASVTARKLFECRKFTSTGAIDTTTRGYSFSNIKLRGRIRGCQNFSGSPVIDLFGTTDGFDWTGEAALNISVEDLYASTSVSGQNILQINGQPFSGNQSVTLKNVFTEGQINRNNWADSKAFDALNVSFSNLVASNGYQTYTPTFTTGGGGQSLGNGSIEGRYTRRGDRIKGVAILTIGSTTNVGSGEFRLSLPVAAASGEGEQLGSAYVLDNGTAHYVGTTRVGDGAAYAIAVSSANVSANVGAASPIAVPANGDVYRFEFDYACAS